jgi:Ca2+/Na+ antiporter
LRIEGVTWSAERIPTAVNFSFLDRNFTVTLLVIICIITVIIVGIISGWFVIPIIYLCTYLFVLLEDYRLIVERRFARRSDAENYAGGSASSW